MFQSDHFRYLHFLLCHVLTFDHKEQLQNTTSHPAVYIQNVLIQISHVAHNGVLVSGGGIQTHFGGNQHGVGTLVDQLNN